MYRAFPHLETGLAPNTNVFDASRIFQRSCWPCFLHLHGSVHSDMPMGASSHDMHEIVWQRWHFEASFAQNSFGRSPQLAVAEPHFPTSVIIAGYGKPTQMLRRPFWVYFSELERLVAECDALLFAGYGFRDQHLNEAFTRFRDGRRRPVAIIDLAKEGTFMFGWPDKTGALAHAAAYIFQTRPESLYGGASLAPRFCRSTSRKTRIRNQQRH